MRRLSGNLRRYDGRTSTVRLGLAGALLALAVLAACEDAGQGSRTEETPPVPDSVDVVFTRDEAPVSVRRPVPDTASSRLRAALEWLVRGPTPEEREAGLRSWFSAETALVLRSVDVDSTGRATVDFEDLRPLIPNASTSAGSAMLLHELNGTAFQFPEVRSVEYRMEGSCDLFWDWLQYGCQLVERPGATPPGSPGAPNV